jgi:phospholipid/cholesterol/gamma-HCH transport system permease protein
MVSEDKAMASRTLDIPTIIGNRVLDGASHVGRLTYFTLDALRGLREVKIWWPRAMTEAWNIGVGSLFIVLLISSFAGAVTALQTGYQFTGSIPYYVVGTLVVSSIVLELGPVLTALILAGRIGARYAAELGTMRVTEQIDALTALGTEPVQYLMVPRVTASVVMMPLLVIMGDAVGIYGGYFVAVQLLGANPVAYVDNSFQYLHVREDVVSGIIKAAVFGLVFSLIACIRGYLTSGGAVGVGRATTRAVVAGSLTVLVVDFFLTKLLF